MTETDPVSEASVQISKYFALYIALFEQAACYL